MQTTLLNFTKQNLFDASRAFFAKIGVKCTDQSCLPINFLSVYEKSVKKVGLSVPQALADVFSKIEATHLIGAVTEDSLAGNVGATSLEEIEAAEQHYKGILLMAVKVKDGVTLTRTEMTQITRGANRIATHNPVTVLILQSGHLSIATCERTQFVQTWRPGERLGKVSILKDVNCLSPHHGHINILKSMDVKKAKTFDALYAQWKEVFSTSLLTKQFYREIQNWYFWALKKEQHVAFPNALDDDSDDEKYNAENIIRLITRLIFTWFMKEKGLVNPDLFNPEFLKTALKSFNPDGTEFFRQDLQDSQDFKDNPVNHVNPVLKQENSCTYYRAILQNLFFATFNQEVGLRDFVDTQVRDAKRYNIKNYYRNEKLFTETDKAKIIGYFNGSPFVNGGLFECLDNVEQNGRVYSWDGFSNSVHFKDGSLKSALIPDCLFFGGETTADLSEFFEKDKSAKNVKVRGIINILNDYVFTIEENTPFDEDVALDPELLGKVFENLLGCYNPETQQMARNATGSFYTPREIVNYMVKVTLKSYLKRACPKVVLAEIDALVEGVAELAEMPSVKEYAKDILTALFKAKILDPACGSGAFPMGIMSAMVEILRTVDPDNKHWYEIVLKESLGEAASIADVDDEQERAVLKAQIEYDFNERVDHPDYARKLYIIEHCIFGSDIQPIAVQISRLRFFITLLCEQTKNDDPTKNYGITPLPNLESNFVAANSLLSIDLKDMRVLLGQKKIISLVKQLRGVRHQLFLPKTSDKKKRLQKKDEELRTAIATAAEGLYDENVLEKSKMLESELRRYDQILEGLTEDDFRDVLRQIEDVNLFGEKSVSIKKVAGRGSELKKRRNMIAAEIESLKNASRKERLLTDIKRLVAWNPFAFNVAETFLDPEWMFGVKEGFDIVIGNPPYISHDKIPDDTPCDKFKSFEPFADIYCYFYEKGLSLLRQQGLISYITSNSFLRANYGLPLRSFMHCNSTIHSLIDIEGTQVFEAAVVNAVIATFINAREDVEATIVNASWDSGTVEEFIEENGFSYRQSDFDMQPWTLVLPENLAVRKTIESKGMSLDKLGAKIRLGLATGDNRAFVLSPVQREMLIEKDPNNDNIIKPVMGGKDIQRYCHSISWYILLTRNEVNVKQDYPTIYQYLDQFGEKFKKRGARGKHWTNLRACAFFDDFKGEKIIWIDLTDKGRFSYSDKEEYLLNSAYFMLPPPNLLAKYLLGLLNSSTIQFYMKQIAATSGVGTLRWINNYVKEFPIPVVPKSEQATIAIKVDDILTAKKSDPTADTSALEAEIDEKVFDLYGLTPEEREIVKGNGK